MNTLKDVKRCPDCRRQKSSDGEWACIDLVHLKEVAKEWVEELDKHTKDCSVETCKFCRKWEYLFETEGDLPKYFAVTNFIKVFFNLEEQ